MKNQPERLLQRKCCNFLKDFYPHIYFVSDVAGIKFSQNLIKIVRSLISDHKHLDLMILEPSREFKAVFIELKAETPYLKNGELSTNPHLLEQYAQMKTLESKGYFTSFCWSEEQFKIIIKNLYGEPKPSNNPLDQPLGL